MSEFLSTVQSLYEAFGRGDVPAILDKLADDVRWEDWPDNGAQKSGVPWMQPRVGREATLDFFNVVGGFTFHEFEVRSLMAGGNQVVADVLVDATIPSGARVRDEELHLWTFDETGKVTRFRHYLDTAKHTAATLG